LIETLRTLQTAKLLVQETMLHLRDDSGEKSEP
jgi:hypothetical protein